MTPPAFVNGDWVYLRSDELSTNLQPEGVQLVKAASVATADAFQLFQMVAGPFATVVHASEALVLLCAQERFLCLGDEGMLDAAASSPEQALVVRAVRIDGGRGTLEVGAHVELRLDDGTRCVQLRPDGRLGVAPAGDLPGTHLVMQSDGAAADALPWADPRCIGINRLPAHVPLRSYRSADAARRGADPRLRLSGCDWGFRLFGAPSAVPPGIENDWPSVEASGGAEAAGGVPAWTFAAVSLRVPPATDDTATPLF